MNKETLICEKLSPNEVYIISQTGDSVKYITNLNGKAIIKDGYLNDKE